MPGRSRDSPLSVILSVWCRVDATREHLLGRIVLERGIALEDDLRRMFGERDDLARRGAGSVSLGQLLVRERRIEVADLLGLQNEIEVRGRACFKCRRAYLVAAGGPINCPACGGSALLPAAAGAPPRPGASAPAPSSAGEPYSPSGHFANSQASGVARLQPGARPDMTASAVARPDMTASAVVRASAKPPSPDSSGKIKARTRGDASSHGGAAAQQWMAQQGVLPSTDPGSKPSSSKGSGGAGSGHAASGPRAPVAPGKELKTLGPYELEKELGRGGMGVVYKARHSQSGETVALKVLLSAEFASKKMVQRFHDEAKLVQKLEHENIVPVLDIGSEGETSYFTMKFIDGDLFSDMIKGRGLSAKHGAEILRDVARGVQHAHENGIIHRDLKPANIIVERDTGRPYLMDFGLAKDLEDDKHLSKTGVAIGTPYYMPPEQALGKHREIDARTDVYALGAMLYEVLAKKVPFNAETQAALLRKIVEDEPVPPSQLKQGVPGDLETIALKAIRKPKDERYPSADAFAQDLTRALKGKEIKAQREAIYAPLVRVVKKNPKVFIGIAVALVVSGGSVGFALYTMNKIESAKREEQEKKDQAEAERKAKEEEEARKQESAKKKTQLEDLVKQGREERLAAQKARDAKDAKAQLGFAVRDFSKAIDLDEPGELRSQALYERGLARVEIGTASQLAAALKDFEDAAKAGKSFRARGALGAGMLVLRRAHDAAEAQKRLEEARTQGEGGGSSSDARAREEEQAAATLAAGYLKFLGGDAKAGADRCREAERSDLAAVACDARSWMAASSTPPDGAAALKAASEGLAQDRFSYALTVDRGLGRALTGEVSLAREDAKTAREVCPDGREAILVDAWIAAVSGNEDDMRSALSDARRDAPPQARDYWQGVEARLVAALGKKSGGGSNGGGGSSGGGGGTPAFGAVSLPLPTGDPPVYHQYYEEFRVQVCEKCAPFLQEVAKLRDEGKMPEAIERLAKLSTEQPHESAWRLWHALFLRHTGRAAEGRADVEKVLAISPDDPLALTLLGEVEQASGNPGKAIEAFDKCLEVRPGFRTPRVLEAAVFRSQKLWSEAVRVLKPCLENDETDGDALNLLVVALSAMNKDGEAMEIAKATVQAAPASFPARVAVMLLLDKAKRAEEALGIAEDGVKADPKNALRLLEKAVALTYLGKTAERDEYLKKAAEAASTNEERSRVESVGKSLRQMPGR